MVPFIQENSIQPRKGAPEQVLEFGGSDRNRASVLSRPWLIRGLPVLGSRVGSVPGSSWSSRRRTVFRASTSRRWGPATCPASAGDGPQACRCPPAPGSAGRPGGTTPAAPRPRPGHPPWGPPPAPGRPGPAWRGTRRPMPAGPRERPARPAGLRKWNGQTWHPCRVRAAASGPVAVAPGLPAPAVKKPRLHSWAAPGILAARKEGPWAASASRNSSCWASPS